MVRKAGNTVNPGNVMQLEKAQRGKQRQFMPPATKEELEEAVEIARAIRQRE